MKAHGKGKPISINDYTSNLNRFKQGLANVSEGVPVIEWKPYKPTINPRQAEMDEYRLMPSWRP